MKANMDGILNEDSEESRIKNFLNTYRKKDAYHFK